jgi:hypothetical protein
LLFDDKNLTTLRKKQGKGRGGGGDANRKSDEYVIKDKKKNTSLFIAERHLQLKVELVSRHEETYQARQKHEAT